MINTRNAQTRILTGALCLQASLWAKEAIPAAYFETVNQEFQIIFRSSEAANKAKIRIPTLYGGKRLAACNRWDDNPTDRSVQTAERCAELGIHGTFYLNGVSAERLRNPKYMNRYKSLARELVKTQAVGVHCWSHPILGLLNDNRRYEELARNRVFTEQITDSHVNAVAWPFVNAGGSRCLRNDPGMARVAEAMFRTGLIGHAQSYGLSVSRTNIEPGTGGSVESAKIITHDVIEKAIAKISRKSSKQWCVWLMNIHPNNYNVDKEIARLEKGPAIPGLWHCTFNQYAAYRNQAIRTKVITKLKEKTLTVRLERPALLDLNDPIGLTFAIDGCKPADVLQIRTEARVDVLSKGTAPYMFSLGHSKDQKLPSQIGAVYNDSNTREILADPEYPHVKGNVFLDGDRLSWTIANTTRTTLTNIRLTARLPLAFVNGVQWSRLKNLAPGEKRSGSIPLRYDAEDAYARQIGKAFCILQLDATCGKAATRFYMTCYKKLSPELDPTYPKQGFASLGPIPIDELDGAQVAKIANGEANTYKRSDGTNLSFTFANIILPRTNKPLGDKSVFNGEFVPTSGTLAYYKKAEYEALYLSRTDVTAQQSRSVTAHTSTSVSAIYVNGKRHTGARSLKVALKKGRNLLVTVSTTKSNYYCKAGFFFRLTSKDPGQRLTDISYHRP